MDEVRYSTLLNVGQRVQWRLHSALVAGRKILAQI